MDIHTRIEKLINENYSLDIGKVVNHSFELWKKTISFSVLFTMIILALLGIYYFVIMSIVFGGIANFLSIFNSNPLDSVAYLQASKNIPYLLLGSLLLQVVIQPIFAGYLSILYKADCNKSYTINDFFTFYRQPYFGQIVIFCVITSFAVSILSQLFILLHLPSYINTLFSVFVSIGSYLMLPFIIFNDFSAINALKNSFQITFKKTPSYFAILVLSLIFAVIGIFGIVIGFLFTFSFIAIFHYATYAQVLGINLENSYDEIDQIGIDS